MMFQFINKNFYRLVLLALFVPVATNMGISDVARKSDQGSYYLIVENDFHSVSTSFELFDLQKKWKVDLISFFFSEYQVTETTFKSVSKIALSISKFVFITPFFIDIPPPLIA
jgi:hypothetical protein